MKKLERNGKIAILYSPEYGAGWSTWNNHEELIFNTQIVQAVLDGHTEEAGKIALKLFPGCCTLGHENLRVMWIPKGTKFRITEFDGNESVEIKNEVDYLIA